MNKKIGLLTLPLIANYGGILQCLSLTYVLKKMGHEVKLINIRPSIKQPKGFIVYILARCPFQNIRGIRESFIKEKQNKATINRYINNHSERIKNLNQLKEEARTFDLDAVIVGSDQVWRYDYINNDMYSAYFLEFCENKACKRISYAASFGVDQWKHEGKRQVTKSLLEKFDAISVRENSGIEICRKEFSIKSVSHVLDPTMLDLTFYDDLLSECIEKHDEDYILKYVLDEKDSAKTIALYIKDKLQIPSVKDIHDNNKFYTLAEWVQAFKNAKYVVTDSFHGMVFAIIFNKNFVAIGNKSRGLSRFVSLLNVLGLKERFIYPEEAKDLVKADILSKDINYDEVNDIIQIWRKKSLDFLINSLK